MKVLSLIKDCPTMSISAPLISETDFNQSRCSPFLQTLMTLLGTAGETPTAVPGSQKGRLNLMSLESVLRFLSSNMYVIIISDIRATSHVHLILLKINR